LGDDLADEGLGVVHRVHILDSLRRQVNAGESVAMGEFPIPRLAGVDGLAFNHLRSLVSV